MTRILDKHAPLKSKLIVLRDSPWYTDDLRRAKQEMRRLQRLARKAKPGVYDEIIADKRKTNNKMIDKCKKEYYSNILEESNNSKTMYSIVNHLLGKEKKEILPQQCLDDILSNFSDYFYTKVKLIRESIQRRQEPELENLDISNNFSEFKPITESDLKKLFMSCPNKSNDQDPIPVSLMKTVSDSILPHLHAIIQSSLQEGSVPQSLKNAFVTPLIKKPTLDPDELKNYRPVSNLAFVSKLLEKVVVSQLNEHLSDNNLLVSQQSAYRKCHSTETALLSVHNDLILAMSEGKAVILVLLDLSAAFDTVDHKLLLKILHQHGLRGTVLNWFQSYIESRSQQIYINKTKSSSTDLDCGVPQGSVLGPILYTIYTSSLSRHLKRRNMQHHLYADDSQLYVAFSPSDMTDITNATSTIENCVSEVKIWMDQHRLKMNDSKTEVLVISRRSLCLPISTVDVGDTSVNVTAGARNIGVFFDSELSLDQHIKNVCRKSQIQLRSIRKIKKFISRSALEQIVHSFITSNIDYCNSLFLGLPKNQLIHLQRIQNAAARMVCGVRKYEHITPVLKDLHWLPVDNRIVFKCMVLIFKCLHGLAPVYLEQLIIPYTPARELRSSQKCNLVVPFSRSSLATERAFSIAGPRLWNALPDDLKVCETLEPFKKILKTHLFELSYQ